MSLRDVQRALGAMVGAHAAAGPGGPYGYAALEGLDLTAGERAWLRGLGGSPGFKVTCDIQRWWRETKLRWTARLTLSALGPGEQQDVIDAYLAAVPCASLFFAAEASRFLEFVARVRGDRTHLAAIARFERALWRAREAEEPTAGPSPGADLSPQDSIRAHPAATIVAFSAPPEPLLAAVLARRPLPAAGTTVFPVLVAPGLPRRWRPATPDEAAVFATALERTVTVAFLRGANPGGETALRELLDVGALCPGPAPPEGPGAAGSPDLPRDE